MFRNSLRVAALALLASSFQYSAQAQNVLELDCAPLPSSRIERDPIVAIHIRVETPDWQVTHIAASGARYERSRQYTLRDATTSKNLSWEGVLIGRPYLRMVGAVQLEHGTLFYTEVIRDERKREGPSVASRASCVPAQATPPAPVSPSGPAAQDSNSQRLTLKSVPSFDKTADGPFSILVIDDEGRPDVIVSGVLPIDAGERFRNAMSSHGVAKHGAYVVLNSTGGSLEGGLALGRAIREMRFDTGLETIYDTAKCYSACAYAFLGGVSRGIGPGYIGFHQFSFASDSAMAGGTAVRTSQEIMMTIDGYLAEMGVSRELLAIATNAEPSKIRLLSPAEADHLRVNFQDESSMKPWHLEALPTGLAMKTESETGSREAEIQCAVGGNIELALRWNRNDYERLPTKQKLMEASPKFTVNGVDSGNYTEIVDDSASSLVIRFVLPIKDAKALILRSNEPGGPYFHAGIYRNERDDDMSNLMMFMPVDDLPADLNVLLTSCH